MGLTVTVFALFANKIQAPFFARKPCGLPQGGMASLASQGSAKMPRGLPRGASLSGKSVADAIEKGWTAATNPDRQET